MAERWRRVSPSNEDLYEKRMARIEAGERSVGSDLPDVVADADGSVSIEIKEPEESLRTPCNLVWQKLEEENREFFEGYYLRLMVKDQITLFNSLLERQVELMRRICPAGVASTPISNGSHIPQLHQNSASYALEHTRPALKSENMGQPLGSSVPNTYANGGSSLHPCMQNAVDMSAHARRIDVSPSLLLAQSSNVAMMQGMNGGMIKSEAGYAGNSTYMFGNGGSVLEARPVIGNPSVSSFSSVESNSHPLNESLLDADCSSFGFLGQIPRDFSLSDLTAGFSNNSDILDYSRSPFLATDTDNFLDPHGGGEYQGDIKRLGTISEGLSYEDFGSD